VSGGRRLTPPGPPSRDARGGAARAGVGLYVIEQGTDTIEGRARSGMLSVLAELRHELIVADTMDGLATARARGPILVSPAPAKLMPPDAR
jgi:DNA invertase Pin-like site-specific DNA recombinase